MKRLFIPLVSVVLLVTPALTCSQEKAADIARPPIESVAFDPHAGFKVNGKPFFPILLYGAPTDEAGLATVRDFGFNTIQCRAEDAAGLAAKGVYAIVRSEKPVADRASILFALGADSPAEYFKQNLLEQTAKVNDQVSRAIPERPVMTAIGYWENEPAGIVEGKVLPKELYEDLVAALDVSAPYLYPVPHQPVASVGEAVARAQAATDGKKPLLPILQLFVWQPGDRYPTPAELRCMAFLALLEGADGIGFYAYNYVTGEPKGTLLPEKQPKLWDSVKGLNHEIAQLGPMLLTGKPIPGVSLHAPTPVKLRGVEHEGKSVVILVNPTQESVTATIDHLPGAAEEVSEISLAPFGVKVLTTLEAD